MRTYKATGINLKGMALGEADRLITVLTPEYGLVRAVAPGARKHKSRLRGKSELFVVNQLLIAKGRSLDKITQAETIHSYPRLSRDLVKLASGQYLGELVLGLALSEQPQTELYELLKEHLGRLETMSGFIIPSLTQAVFHLLAIAGFAPEVKACCMSQQSLQANFQDGNWQVGFSFNAGGIVNLSSSEFRPQLVKKDGNQQTPPRIHTRLGAIELTLLQQLAGKNLPPMSSILPPRVAAGEIQLAWMKVERVLRDYAQYHLGRAIRSAALIENTNYPA